MLGWTSFELWALFGALAAWLCWFSALAVDASGAEPHTNPQTSANDHDRFVCLDYRGVEIRNPETLDMETQAPRAECEKL